MGYVTRVGKTGQWRVDKDFRKGKVWGWDLWWHWQSERPFSLQLCDCAAGVDAMFIEASRKQHYPCKVNWILSIPQQQGTLWTNSEALCAHLWTRHVKLRHLAIHLFPINGHEVGGIFTGQGWWVHQHPHSRQRIKLQKSVALMNW